MTLEQQLTSLEISKRLKELGMKQESLFYYWKYGSLSCPEITGDRSAIDKRPDEHYSAFTVAELGEMLPLDYYSLKSEEINKWECGKFGSERGMFAESEADARGKMLIYLLENKLITL